MEKTSLKVANCGISFGNGQVAITHNGLGLVAVGDLYEGA